MADTTKEVKNSFFKGVKTEFKKIIWPNKKLLGRETVAVIVISVIIGVIIAVLDTIFKFGFGLIL